LDRTFFEDYAKNNNLKLSSIADKVIKAINKKNGNCPCRMKEVPCPCPMHKDEVEKQGSCTCNLFVKREKE